MTQNESQKAAEKVINFIDEDKGPDSNPKIIASAFLEFFEGGQNAEDFLKSENELKKIAAEIYEKEEIESDDLKSRRLKAEQALKFINEAKSKEKLFL